MKMNSILFLLLALVTATHGVRVSWGSDDRPNIIVMISDDSGYNEFSLNGSSLFPTPEIDSIAADGVQFLQGYTSGTVCSPTRARLLTGRYQNRFGHEFNIPPVYSDEHGLSLEETTLPEVLQSSGYRTIAIKFRVIS